MCLQLGDQAGEVLGFLREDLCGLVQNLFRGERTVGLELEEEVRVVTCDSDRSFALVLGACAAQRTVQGAFRDELSVLDIKDLLRALGCDLLNGVLVQFGRVDLDLRQILVSDTGQMLAGIFPLGCVMKT